MGFSRRRLLRISGLGAGAAAAYLAWPEVSGLLARNEPARIAEIPKHATLPLFDQSAVLFSKIVAFGDSNAAGTGQDNGFYGGFLGRLSRSILNFSDALLHRERGSSYVTLMSPYLELKNPNGWFGYLEGGFLEGRGAAGDLGILVPGSSVKFTRKLAAVKFAYHPTLSKGARWEVAVRKTVIASGIADESGSTGDIPIPRFLGLFSIARDVKFSCTEGKIYYQDGEITSLADSQVPRVWCAPQGSQGFQDFSTEERVRSIAPHVNARNGKTLVLVMLGTNNLVGAAYKQLPPDQYVAALDALLSTWSSALDGELVFALVMPPKPRLQLPYANHEEYMVKTLEYAQGKPGISLVRTDLSILGGDVTAALYAADGLHLNGNGHKELAGIICQHLGVPYDDYFPSTS